METERTQKENNYKYENSAPKRSLSYNDLKKKRLMRSQKSKTKLRALQKQQIIISKTQKKRKIQNTSQDIKAISVSASHSKFVRSQLNKEMKMQKQIVQIKDIFQQINPLKSKIKKSIISKPFHTDRGYLASENDKNKSCSFKQKIEINKNFQVNIQQLKSNAYNLKSSIFFNSLDMAGKQKDLIKKIISKKKSQRKLLKFDQIRNEVKRSKSKSKERSMIDFKEDQERATHLKINNEESSSQIKLQNYSKQKSRKNIRINKFETVRQPSQNNDEKQQNTEPVRKYFSNQIEKMESLKVKLSNSQQNSKVIVGNYKSRRKLKIDDLQTERKFKIQNNNYLSNNQQNLQKNKEKSFSSFINNNIQISKSSKMKFHRKLRKSNSQIVFRIKQKQKTFQISNEQKSLSKIINKSAILNKQKEKCIIDDADKKHLFQNNRQNLHQIIQSSKKSHLQINFINSQTNDFDKRLTNKSTSIQNFSRNKQKIEVHNNILLFNEDKIVMNEQKNQLKGWINWQNIKVNKQKLIHQQKKLEQERQFQQINISDIMLKKQNSYTDFDSEMNIVQAMEEEQFQRQWSKHQKMEEQKKEKKRKIGEIKQIQKGWSKKSQFVKETNENEAYNASFYKSNAENMQNLSNILQFIALPTKQLKIKITRSSKICKKKNQLDKFKKIFPSNFFNNN